MKTPFDELDPPKRKRHPILAGLRNSFLTGLIVIAPIGLTCWLMWTVVGWVDGWVLPFVPNQFRPEQYIGINLRGVGLIFFLLFTVMVGWVAKGIIGRSLLKSAEGLLDGVPVVRSIYSGLKQIAETVFSQSDSSFDKACLVEYPRKGIWAIAFISSPAKYEMDAKIPVSEGKVAVFLPTTPNPTSGFLLFVPRSDVIELDMTVEDAAKLIISAGLVYPNGREGVEPPIQITNPTRLAGE